MATSSILKQVNIDDPEKVKRFIEALEEAEKFAEGNKDNLLARTSYMVNHLSKEDLQELLENYGIEFKNDKQ